MDVLRQEDGIDVRQGFDGTCTCFVINDTDTLVGSSFIYKI